jgi:ADP-ribose pyrophosphatase YjhB (NUDIX family)
VVSRSSNPEHSEGKGEGVVLDSPLVEGASPETGNAESVTTDDSAREVEAAGENPESGLDLEHFEEQLRVVLPKTDHTRLPELVSRCSDLTSLIKEGAIAASDALNALSDNDLKAYRHALDGFRGWESESLERLNEFYRLASSRNGSFEAVAPALLANQARRELVSVRRVLMRLDQNSHSGKLGPGFREMGEALLRIAESNDQILSLAGEAYEDRHKIANFDMQHRVLSELAKETLAVHEVIEEGTSDRELLSTAGKVANAAQSMSRLGSAMHGSLRTRLEIMRQVACLPFCRTFTGKYKILLCTNDDKSKWQIPKGKLREGWDPRATAMEEGFEEAGINTKKAVLENGVIGSFWFEKKGRQVEAEVYLLEVKGRLLRNFPHLHLRRRGWFSPQEAIKWSRPRVRDVVEKSVKILDERFANTSLVKGISESLAMMVVSGVKGLRDFIGSFRSKK